MMNVMFSVTMKKINEIMINVTMWINTENFLSEKKTCRKNHPNHAHLAQFKSNKVFFRMREHPSNE